MIISGMSRSPRGSGSEASNSSSMIHIPASPFQTLCAVRSRRWSWYHWNAARSGAPVLEQLVGVGAPSAGLDQQVVA